MFKRLVGYVLLVNIVIVLLIPTTFSAPLQDEDPWWDYNWNSRKEVVIQDNIDTGDELAHYQPVDIYIEFDDLCWAKNENEYSIRVIFQDEGRFLELESQIYDLVFLDESHISSCGLVFLIPKEANGKEKYFVYYDDTEKSAPNYPNHVDVGESYYRFVQIGLTLESSYYKIVEGDYAVYAINKWGKAYDTTASQQVGKLKKETEDVSPKNGEVGAVFCFIYWWERDGDWIPTSSAERLVNNKILVDGNLMVKIGIESESNDGLLKSTVIYKYYFCPTEDKRIYTHVKHEIIKYPLPLGDEIDVSFILLNFGTVKSNNMDELNFGDIPPYMHFYSDEDRIFSYNVDQYPEDNKFRGYILKKDDYDLGSSPWLSIDYGESGKAHAIIFETNKLIKNGTDERDGIELQLYEANSVQLPGLDARLAYLYFMRNAYEKEDVVSDELLPENYVVEFNAEFFTTENGGYPTVEKEAKMYQSLIKLQPTRDEDITDNTEETPKYNLTAYVHFASSFPFGSILSTTMGKNVSYLTAEIYKDNNFISQGSVCRLPLSNKLPANFLELSLAEQIKMLPTLFDWKNLSFFKKITFPNLEKGRYLVEIFRENPFFSKERQFIGYAILELDGDKTTHIYCKSEGKVRLSILNQDGNGVEDVDAYLLKDDVTLVKGNSDSNGDFLLKAPCGVKETYNLIVKYKGFLINNDEIRLGAIRKYIPLKMTFDLNLYNLDITIKDSLGNAPTFDVDLGLTSDEMQDPVILNANDVFNGVHKFKNLYPANYTLIINYNSFEIKEKIQIPSIESKLINLYDFTAYIKDSWNLPPGTTLDVTLASNDFEKTAVVLGEQLSGGEYHFSNIYPGNYTLKARYKSFTTEQLVNIPDSKDIVVEFSALFNVTATIFDSHGNPLSGAKVLMIRGEEGNEKEAEGTTDENGLVIFSLPPGNYILKIFSDDNLVAKRNVEVINDKIFAAVTTSEPLLPSIITGLTAVFLIGVGIICFRRKDAVFFLKMLAISLAVIAIVSPWWAVHGSSSNPYTETSTIMFLKPAEMVTITSNNNVTVGELSELQERLKNEFNILFTTVTIEFSVVMDLLPTVLIVGFASILLSLILARYSKDRLSLLVFLFTILIFAVCIIGFYYAMSEVANQTVGSFAGSGNLEVDIPGENQYETLSCSWGPNLGFYLLLVSICTLIFAFYLDIRMTIIKKSKKVKQGK